MAPPALRVKGRRHGLYRRRDGLNSLVDFTQVQTDKINIFKAKDGADVKVTIRPVRTPPGRHNGWNIEMKSAKSPEDTRRLFRALIACRPRAVRRRVGGRGHEWFDEELSERRVSYESAVPELPAVAVSRQPDASINSDLAGNDAVCSTCPSRPSP